MDSRLLEMTYGIEAQEARVANEDVLLMLLRRDLGPFHLMNMARKYYMFMVDYKGQERIGVVFGCCRGEVMESEKVQAFVDDMWGEREYDDPDESVIFETFVEDGCFYLLRDDLEAMQMLLLERAYDIISVTHEGRERKAIDCLIYNDRRDGVDREPQVLHQVLLGDDKDCGT